MLREDYLENVQRFYIFAFFIFLIASRSIRDEAKEYQKINGIPEESYSRLSD